MCVIEIKFIARRYHATPWDAHVNEGRIEWPPSPWRLLRALIAVGYNKLGWTDKPSPAAIDCLNKLAGSVPEFSVPHGTASHTRHYMPVRSGRSEKKAKVFDSFIRFASPDDSILVKFDVELTEEESSELRQLVEGLAYLGRAESWVEAKLILSSDSIDDDSTCWVRVADDSDTRRVRLLAPLASDDYKTWREREVTKAHAIAEKQLEDVAAQRGRKVSPAARKKALSKSESVFPVSIVESLQRDNAVWQSESWPRPPGSRWVDYAIGDRLLETLPVVTVAPSPKYNRPTTILLSIDGEGKRGTLRPRTKRVLPLMELLHSEAVRYAGKLGLGHLSELTGTHADGTPLGGSHQHAHWLPMSLLQPGAIDHVLVYAPGGFSQSALRAISSIRWAYAKGISALSVNMVGRGSMDDVRKQLSRNDSLSAHALSIVDESTSWHTATPLVLRKYLHRRGKKTVEGQVREELSERGFPNPVSIEVWPQQRLVEHKLKGFVLRRGPRKRQPPAERSWGITITFERPVSGPISVGYASHYGLGMLKSTLQP
ncbi:type I-G CRISPR-associated protein Csb2 [Rhodopirellula sp. JC639]|uniref:type I-G CRISPR-associated protein Csb2 n=1 Tax=Stieleria mannarensis TaxID=2755585 RepID=UPI0016013F40|nr:type I-U CRISPR-associated protein Csb2 [Rhodopirellula sp. JC639]